MMLILCFLVLNLPVEHAVVEEQAVVEGELPVLAGNELEEADDVVEGQDLVIIADVVEGLDDVVEGQEADQDLILAVYDFPECDFEDLILDAYDKIIEDFMERLPNLTLNGIKGSYLILAAYDMIIEDFMERLPFDPWSVEETRTLYILYMRHTGRLLAMIEDPDVVPLLEHRPLASIGYKILGDDAVAFNAGIPAPWLTMDRLLPIERVAPLENPWDGIVVGGDRVIVFDDESLALADWVHAFDAAYDALTFEEDN